MSKMIKFLGALEGFQEIPNEVSLLLNLTLCMNACPGCHSPELQADRGVFLSKEVIDFYLKEGPYTCVCFMGEGADRATLTELMAYVKSKKLKVAVYCGRDIDVSDWCQEYKFVPDFLKVGSYKEELGPLTSPTTNQRLYDCSDSFTDITQRFWRKLND